jgi:hypothetical protein
MNRVSLVCTVHEELGRANVVALRAILERMQSDVIFLEVPPEALKNYLENSQKVEAAAVNQYRLAHQVEPVPVDLLPPTQDFDSNSRYLFNRIEKVSRTFCLLMDSNSTYVRTEGFTYLNSERSSKLWSDIYDEVVSTIKCMNNNPELVAIYESWKETNDRRERAMMENIQKYCRENTFDKGVFLIGAAHRRAIIDLSKEQSGIRWDFAGHWNQQGDA